MRKIIAIVGMPGAGKSEAGTFFKEKGMDVLRFGSVIDEGIAEEGLPWTPENNKYYREKIRKELGMAAVAVKMLSKIEDAHLNNDIILDGLYSWEEYVFLKEKFPELFLLCIYARPVIRYVRLANRPERVWTREESRERDIAEIQNLNKGGPIALADYMIENNTTKTEFITKLEIFFSTIQK